jgi:3,4-dihydroxy-2-butanone 4-phosphate synthase
MSAVTEPATSPFASIEEAIEEIRSGRFVVVVDDEDRENEGDLTIAAQFVTPDAVNFMAIHGRGLICLCLTPERCDELGLRQMTDQNEAQFGTAFTVSIEAREGVSTGISAADRAHTIQVAVGRRRRATSSSRGTCSPCGPGPVVSSSGRARPKRQSISPGLPVSNRPAWCARS